MQKHIRLLLLITTSISIYGCDLPANLNSSSDADSLPSSVDSTYSISPESIIDSSLDESIDEISSSDIITEEISSLDLSTIESSSEEISSTDESTSEDNSTSPIEEEIENFTIGPTNYTDYSDISYTGVAINTRYSDELAISPNGKIEASGFDYIDSIQIHVYGTYDNLVVSSENGTITATKETLGEGNKTSVKYTYDFAGSHSFIIDNPSTYVVNCYTITIYYKGKSGVILPEVNIPDTEFSVGWTNQDYGTYYSSISDSLSGTNLLKALQNLNSTNRKRTVGYSSLWNYYNKTDYDPNNPSKYIAFYLGTSASKSDMNKEHVWPNSRGGNLVEDDIHMARPTLKADNTSRGNSFYVEGKNSTTDGWDPANVGNPIYRGISARIIFYCCVASNKLSLVDLDNDATSNKTMGKLSNLLYWNLQYPVDDSELRRNKGAQDIQGNRNPFIDNTSFACAIWGNTNSTTKAICAKSHK